MRLQRQVLPMTYSLLPSAPDVMRANGKCLAAKALVYMGLLLYVHMLGSTWEHYLNLQISSMTSGVVF
jgi:hypothetical protein